MPAPFGDHKHLILSLFAALTYFHERSSREVYLPGRVTPTTEGRRVGRHLGLRLRARR